MLSLNPISSSSSPKWKRFYSSTSLIDPHKHIDVSTWIILSVALLILSSAFVILYLVWRNQRNARKEALEGEVEGGMTFGEEYGVDLCKVNGKFRGFAKEHGSGRVGTEMFKIKGDRGVLAQKKEMGLERSFSSPLSGKTLREDNEIVEQSHSRCPPGTPSSFTAHGSYSSTTSPIPTCKPDRNDRESTVERELMEIEKEGKPRGGWWNTSAEIENLPRGGSKDFGFMKLPKDIPESGLCSAPTAKTPASPKQLPAIFHRPHSSPAPISLPVLPTRLPLVFQGLPASPAPVYSTPPAMPPHAAARGRSPVPGPINTTRSPPRKVFEEIEEEFPSPFSTVIHAPTLTLGHHYSQSQHRKYSNTPLPALPGQKAKSLSPAPSQRSISPQVHDFENHMGMRDPSPEPELGMGREVQIRKSKGKMDHWSPRYSQTSTAIASPGLASPRGRISPARIESRSPSPFLSAPTNTTNMTKISEQLRISAAEDVSTLCRPTSPLPTTPTPRTQLAQAVGAAMVQALNGRIQQHKLQQYQYPSPDGSYGRGNESRVREVREVQSLA